MPSTSAAATAGAVSGNFLPFFQVQLARCWRGKKIIVLAVILTLPVVLSIARLAEGGEVPWDAVNRLVGVVYMPFLLPLIALFYGGPLIVDEIEQRTYLYLIVRPLARTLLFLGKLLAAWVTTVALVAASLVVFIALQAPILAETSDLSTSILRLAASLLLGSAAYVALFAALASLFGRSILAGVLYYILFEGFLGRLPVLEYLSIRFHLFNVMAFTPERTTTELLLQQGIDISPFVSGVVLALAAAVFVGVGMALSAWREYTQ